MEQTSRRVRHGIILALLCFAVGCATFGSQRTQLTAPEASIVANVLDEVLAPLNDSGVVCLQIMSDARGSAPAMDAILPRLQTRRRVVREADCPPTYTQMVIITDSLGRPTNPKPPGYVDPHRIQLSRPQFVASHSGSVEVQHYQGTVGRRLRCEVWRRPTVTSSECEEVSWWVH